MKKKKKSSFGLNLVIVFVLSACAILVAFPLIKNLKFGLDLKGGFEVLYEVEGLNGEEVTNEMVLNTYKTMLKRIDALGVSEPNITIEGDNRIRVQLAGVTEQSEARSLLSKTASLTFRDTSDNLLATASVLKSGGAKVSTDEYMNYVVSLGVADNEAFYNMTKSISEMEDNRIVIWLDYENTDSFKKEEKSCGSLGTSRCISVAYVREGFSSDVIIQGNFTEDEAKSLVELINSGSLPTKLNEISSRTVEASFGANTLSKTLKAGIIGIIAIMVLMIILYRFSGFISSIGILLYTVITLGVFWVVGGVLTLPGIAAMVIGIGMAVDASVISFSRIKDELDQNSSLSSAYEHGNQNSFKSILDANLTTLIAAIILFIFGESTVKGFATMLIISTITTMFVMVFITRLLLKEFANCNIFANKLGFFIGYKKKDKKLIDKINLKKLRNASIVIYAVIFITGIVFLIINGLNLGIDFKGGTTITINSEKFNNADDVKESLKDYNYEISNIEEVDDTNYIVTISNTLSPEDVTSLEDYYLTNYEAKTDIGVISNVVKKELIKNSIISIILAFIGIIIYVTFRFSFNYGISSIIAILVDLAVTVFIFAIFNLEVSTIFIAAILSIIGYSINDTIVTFDRVKENLKNKEVNKLKNIEALEEVLNKSLKGVFMRSIYTTVTTLLPIVALMIFGSHEIFNFNIAMLVGLISGVASSLLISTFIWYLLEKKNIGKPNKKKWYEEDTKEEMKIKGVNC